MSDITYTSLLINMLPTVDLHTKDGVCKVDKFTKLPLNILEELFKSSINKVPFCIVSGCRFETAVNSYRYCEEHKYMYCQTCICQNSCDIESCKVYDNPHFKDLYLCFNCISLFIRCGVVDEHFLLKSHLKNVKVGINIKKECN